MDKDTQLSVLGNENADENDIDFSVEQTRPRALLVAGAIGALMLAILIVALVMTKPGSDQELENMLRAGAPEYDAYKNKVTLEIDPESRMVYDNWLGMWTMHAKAKFANNGERELLSVEVVGKLIDYQDKVLAESVMMSIPRSNPGPLKPGESKIIGVKVDAPPKVTEGEVKDIRIELRGLRFQ